MVTFELICQITNTTDAEALICAEWIKDNYSAVSKASFQSLSKLMTVFIYLNSFNDLVDAIQAFKTEFNDRLQTYNFDMNQM